jgi:dihydrofolate synthase/folylpolyglutamate synthase
MQTECRKQRFSHQETGFLKTKNYLDSFINYERLNSYPYKKSIKLERTKKLLEALNIPYRDLSVIHIAGTKGKGSTATFVAYILACSGFKVGLYTSPHFADFRERIKKLTRSQNHEVATSLISREDVVRIIERFRPRLEYLKSGEQLGKITFFEVYTALAFSYFIEKKLDFVILETGLGGRLDATNVVEPLISIITHIGYDHTHSLGNKLQEIAHEKAGIIKNNSLVVSSSQRKQALKEIIKSCRLKKSDLVILGRDFKFANTKINQDYARFDFKFNDTFLKGLKIRLRGVHQIENASLAVAALLLLKNKGVIKQNLNIKLGLKSSQIEGRFQIVNLKPLVVLDIAHNASSFSVLDKALKDYFPDKKIILIFAASRDKDIRKMLQCIDYDKIIITSFDNPRSLGAAEIKHKCRLKQAKLALNIKEALQVALRQYNSNSVIVVSGSFFIVAEAREMLKKKSGNILLC